MKLHLFSPSIAIARAATAIAAIATLHAEPRSAPPVVVPPTPDVVPGGAFRGPATTKVDVSKLRPPPATGSAPINGLPKGKLKKPSLAPSGVWKWTTFNRNMQPVENTITLSNDKKGNITGKLIDRQGEHDIKNITVGDASVSFDVDYHSRGVGSLARTFTVSLDPDIPAVAVDEPDLSPLGKAKGGKSHHEMKAKHDPVD